MRNGVGRSQQVAGIESVIAEAVGHTEIEIVGCSRSSSERGCSLLDCRIAAAAEGFESARMPADLDPARRPVEGR